MRYSNIKYDKNLNNEELYIKAKSGCLESKDKLIKNVIPLVVSMSKKWLRRTGLVDLDEVIGIGMIGLMKAYKHYDLKRNLRFSTFASVAIWREFIKTADTAKRSNRSKYETVSLDVDLFEDDIPSRHETIPNKSSESDYSDVLEKLTNQQIIEHLQSISTYTDNEKIVLKEHFIGGKSLSDIGREYNKSRQTIHQTYQRCIKRMENDRRIIRQII